MVAERGFGAAIDECLHRLGRIHVLIAHEPARLIGADRQQSELERAVTFACFAKRAAIAIAGIGNEIDFSSRRFDDE